MHDGIWKLKIVLRATACVSAATLMTFDLTCR